MAAEPIELGFATLGAALVAAVAPGIVAYITSLIHSREKKEDWARQDAVARQAAMAAKLLLAAQAETTQQNTETQGKLNQIHTLVNSNLTKEMYDRLVSLRAQIALTKEVMSLKHTSGMVPDAGTIKELRSLEVVAANLEVALAERSQATIAADLVEAKNE